MTLSEKLITVFYMPSAFWHLIKVKQALRNKPYNEILNEINPQSEQKTSIPIIVKSYFWSCRLIPNCNCLPRSIALYQKLTLLGYDVKHKFGVLKLKPKDPLAAHAWVELDGRALNESKNLDLFVELKKDNDIQNPN